MITLSLDSYNSLHDEKLHLGFTIHFVLLDQHFHTYLDQLRVYKVNDLQNLSNLT